MTCHSASSPAPPDDIDAALDRLEAQTSSLVRDVERLFELALELVRRHGLT